MNRAAIITTLLAAGVAAVTLAAPDDAAQSMRAKLAAIDTDHDGRWSKAEWLAAGRSERGFNLMDTDHDGYLTIAELKAGLAKLREMRTAKAAQ